MTGERNGEVKAAQERVLTVTLSRQPPERDPLEPGSTKTESDCTEEEQTGEREREVLAWAPQPGKKLGLGGAQFAILRKVVTSDRFCSY